MKHLLTLALLLAPLAALHAAESPKPNVVYLLADDLGWGDLSRNGGKIPTPAIDKLFTRGVELQNFMGWCVCSPTRAMLLTGRHPFRVGTGPEVGGELAAEETTIAEGFKANGYRTGVFGKWHNGDDPDTPEYRAAFAEAWKSMPNKKLKGGLGANAHGFDDAWVYYGGGADYFTRRTVQGRGPVSWWHNREFRPQDTGYTDDHITQRALEFIRASKETPFFCYVPFHLVHAPLQAKDEDLAAMDPKIGATLPAASPKATDAEKRIHAAMLRSLDQNVAIIVAELDRLGLSDNTILVFTSDNGAMEAGSSLPLRGAKHTIYEGGVRLPTVMHWPKGGLTGGTKWDGLCGGLDMFPTLIAMTDSKMPTTRPLDGKNIWPALRARKVRSRVTTGRGTGRTRFARRSGNSTASLIASSFTISGKTSAKPPTSPRRTPPLSSRSSPRWTHGPARSAPPFRTCARPCPSMRSPRPKVTSSKSPSRSRQRRSPRTD